VYIKKGNAQVHLVVSTIALKAAVESANFGGFIFTQLHF
jgi:hypothetical protein